MFAHHVEHIGVMPELAACPMLTLAHRHTMFDVEVYGEPELLGQLQDCGHLMPTYVQTMCLLA